MFWRTKQKMPCSEGQRMPCSEGQSKGCHVLKDNVNCKESNEKKPKKLCCWCRVKMCLLMVTTICRVWVCPCCNSKLIALTHARTCTRAHTHLWCTVWTNLIFWEQVGRSSVVFYCFISFLHAALCLSKEWADCSTGCYVILVCRPVFIA